MISSDSQGREICDGKLCLSYRQARQIINDTKRRQHRNHSKKIPKREYICPKCGCYHLTSDARKFD